MTVYASLPAPSYSLISRSTEALIQLRQPSQGIFTKEITARFELGVIFAKSLAECGLHVSMTGVCLATAIVKVPVYRVLGGVTPEAALIIDAGSHLIRAIKLVVVAPLALLAGLIRPEWSVDMYRGAGLVKLAPKAGLCAALGERFQNVITTVLQSVNRQHVMGATAALVTLIGVRYWSVEPAPVLVPMPDVGTLTNYREYLPLEPVLGLASVFGVGVVRALQRMTVKRKGHQLPPVPTGQIHPVAGFLRGYRVQPGDYVGWTTSDGSLFGGEYQRVDYDEYGEPTLILADSEGWFFEPVPFSNINEQTMVFEMLLAPQSTLKVGDYVYHEASGSRLFDYSFNGVISKTRVTIDETLYTIGGKECSSMEVYQDDVRAWRPMQEPRKKRRKFN